jgi:hypothetical protein
VTFSRIKIAGPNQGQFSDPTNRFFPPSPIPTTPKTRSRATSSSSTAGITTNYFCFPEKNPPKPKRTLGSRNFLSPLLKDILALVAAQPSLQTPQYFTTFVLTDGEFCDVEESSQVCLKLQKKIKMHENKIYVNFVGTRSSFASSSKCCIHRHWQW